MLFGFLLLKAEHICMLAKTGWSSWTSCDLSRPADPRNGREKLSAPRPKRVSQLLLHATSVAALLDPLQNINKNNNLKNYDEFFSTQNRLARFDLMLTACFSIWLRIKEKCQLWIDVLSTTRAITSPSLCCFLKSKNHLIEKMVDVSSSSKVGQKAVAFFIHSVQSRQRTSF